MKTLITLLSAASALSVLYIGSLSAEGKDVILSAAPDKVFEVLLEVVAGEYRIEDVNKDAKTVSFRSGTSMRSWNGQDASCIVLPQEEGTKSKVICNTEKRGKALTTWGEGGAIQKKVLQLLTKELFKRQLIPAKEVVK